MLRFQFLKNQIAGRHIYDYIIIGAGVAGLHAAQLLTQNKVNNILILEAQNQIGGRIFTYKLADIPTLKYVDWIQGNENAKNHKIQKGATWIQPQHHYVKKLASNLGIKLIKQYDKGHSVYITKQNVYNNEQLVKDPKIGKAILEIIQKLEILAMEYDKTILSATRVTKQYKEMLARYDSMTIDQYLKKQIKSQFLRTLFDNFIEHTECADCRYNSMHQLLMKNARSFDLQILKTFLGAFQSDSSYLLEGGTHTLLRKIKNQIQRNIKQSIDKILIKNSPVVRIQNQLKQNINVHTSNGQIYACKQIILAVPIAVAKNIKIEKLSLAKKLIFQNQVDNIVSKTFVFARKPFWNATANGDSLFDQSVNINMGHDISPQNQSCGIMVFFHSGHKYLKWLDQWKGRTNEDKRKYMIKLMAKMFMNNDESNVDLQNIVIYQSTYLEDPYIRAGFQSNTKPGIFTKILNMGQSLDSYYNDQNNIIFIGSQYSRDCASYIQGAVRVTRQKILNRLNVADLIKSQIIARKS